MDVQVPPRTNFHEFPWKSTVEVPWQVVPGPAAQSFWPFKATPKHFCLWAATAAFASALVRGPALARVVNAVVIAPARTSELTALFVDMIPPQICQRRRLYEDACPCSPRLKHSLLWTDHDPVNSSAARRIASGRTIAA